MKKILLFVPVLFLAIDLSAQISLTQSNEASAIGDVFTSYKADTSAQPGSGGANHTWTITAALTGAVLTQTFVNPTSTPGASTFSSANVADLLSNSGYYQYATSSSSSMIFRGVYAGSSSTVNFPTGITYYTFPFTYNSMVNNSSVSGTFTGGTITGSTAMLGDGYGTLILNGITHSNVLRTKLTENLVYNYTGLGTQTNNIITYWWYDGVHKNPLFEISTADGFGIFNITHSKIVYVSDYATGVNEIVGSSFHLDVYPNPAQGKMMVGFRNDRMSQVVISMFDMEGRLVFEKDLGMPGASDYREQIDLEKINRGIYVLQVASEGIFENKRIVIE